MQIDGDFHLMREIHDVSVSSVSLFEAHQFSSYWQIKFFTVLQQLCGAYKASALLLFNVSAFFHQVKDMGGYGQPQPGGSLDGAVEHWKVRVGSGKPGAQQPLWCAIADEVRHWTDIKCRHPCKSWSFSSMCWSSKQLQENAEALHWGYLFRAVSGKLSCGLTAAFLRKMKKGQFCQGTRGRWARSRVWWSISSCKGLAFGLLSSVRSLATPRCGTKKSGLLFLSFSPSWVFY